MKSILLSAIALFATITMIAAPKIQIQNIEPQNWYVGMNNPQLQILLTGAGIRDAEVSTNYPGARIDSLVRLDSPNYLFVYVNLKDAQPGQMPMNITLGKKKQVVNYPLLAREMAGKDRKGFSNEDVLYMFMPDRFAQGRQDNSKLKTRIPYTIDRKAPSMRHGGDLEGVRQHLDHFCDLGVTALWLTPVLENDMPEGNGQSAYHGYATTDYYKVDPRFGTNEEYRRLIDDCHARGLKVVMDMIFNHCGSEHPWMHDAPSQDWFNNPNYGLQTSYKLTPVIDPYASDVDMRETVDGWFVRSMPDLNQRNPHLMRYLIQNSEWWIEAFGIDGIRMDTYPYADARGMAQWMKTLNDEYPNFNVVGESWVTEPGFTAALQHNSGINQNVLEEGKVQKAFTSLSRSGSLSAERAGGESSSYLNTVMDFTFFDRINTAKAEETDDWWKGLNRIYNTFVYDCLYADPSHVLAFLDNHDTDRFLGKEKDSLALKQGLALLLTINRIPQIYYGTEIMMTGTKEITDGYVREDFPGGFPGDKRNAFTAEGRTNAENAMYNWLRSLLHWRKGAGRDIITKGQQKQFIPWQGVYVMHHQYQDRHCLVIINGKNEPNEFQSSRYAECIPDGTMATEITSQRKYGLSKNIKLRPRQTLVLEY